MLISTRMYLQQGAYKSYKHWRGLESHYVFVYSSTQELVFCSVGEDLSLGTFRLWKYLLKLTTSMYSRLGLCSFRL